MRVYILAICLGSLISCSHRFERKTVDGLFSVEVITSMSPSELNDVADFEYANEMGELYIIVIEESREEVENVLGKMDLNGYTRLAMQQFTMSLKELSGMKANDIFIGPLPAKAFEFSCTVEGARAQFYMAVIESKNHFYQVMSWTLEDYYKANKKSLRRMVHSFKELH